MFAQREFHIVRLLGNTTNKILYDTLTEDYNTHNYLLDIYPNPANDKLTIEFDHNGNYALMVYDNLGNSVLRERMIFDSEKEILDISALSPGIYFVSISSEANVFTRKIVVE